MRFAKSQALGGHMNRHRQGIYLYCSNPMSEHEALLLNRLCVQHRRPSKSAPVFRMHARYLLFCMRHWGEVCQANVIDDVFACFCGAREGEGAVPASQRACQPDAATTQMEHVRITVAPCIHMRSFPAIQWLEIRITRSYSTCRLICEAIIRFLFNCFILICLAAFITFLSTLCLPEKWNDFKVILLMVPLGTNPFN